MRLVTRGDMDGLTCAVLITETEKVDEIVLVVFARQEAIPLASDGTSNESRRRKGSDR